ncbi:MAG TPA: type VI secretion system domain-containing protein, partial [Longimicrobiales bacterium]
LVAPSTEVRTRLKTLLLAERWRELLEVGEEAMAGPAGRAWLDLQRYTVAACDALAGEHARIGAAVRSELRGLLRDLPAIVSTTLTDDTPSANGDTLAWLRAEGLLADGGDAAPISLLRGDPLHQAQQLARAGQAQKAVDLLMREASQERSARGRFLRRSQAATIMVESGMDAVALPILQQLVEQVQRFSREEWEESDTVTRTLGLLYRCLNRLQGANATTQELYLRICRLDPMYALQLQAAS